MSENLSLVRSNFEYDTTLCFALRCLVLHGFAFGNRDLEVYLILIVSLVMGGIFGLVFGVMDVEDEVSFQIRLALRREEGMLSLIHI